MKTDWLQDKHELWLSTQIHSPGSLNTQITRDLNIGVDMGIHTDNKQILEVFHEWHENASKQ